MEPSKQELERGKFILSSDRNIAVGTVIAILIFGSFLRGITDIGLTIFAVSSLGLILIWLVVALIILAHGSTLGDRSLCHSPA